MKRIIDITLPVSPQLPSWPGEPKLTTSLLRDMSQGHSCNVSRIEGGVRAGARRDTGIINAVQLVVSLVA